MLPARSLCPFKRQSPLHPCTPALHNAENVLALKDPARPFPTGAPLGVLKWRLQTRDESLVPLTINCWPSVSGEGVGAERLGAPGGGVMGRIHGRMHSHTHTFAFTHTRPCTYTPSLLLRRRRVLREHRVRVHCLV